MTEVEKNDREIADHEETEIKEAVQFLFDKFGYSPMLTFDDVLYDAYELHDIRFPFNILVKIERAWTAELSAPYC